VCPMPQVLVIPAKNHAELFLAQYRFIFYGHMGSLS